MDGGRGWGWSGVLAQCQPPVRTDRPGSCRAGDLDGNLAGSGHRLRSAHNPVRSPKCHVCAMGRLCACAMAQPCARLPRGVPGGRAPCGTDVGGTAVGGRTWRAGPANGSVHSRLDRIECPILLLANQLCKPGSAPFPVSCAAGTENSFLPRPRISEEDRTFDQDHKPRTSPGTSPFTLTPESAMS